ncbi:MAG: SURF1 family protein [Erythrobacter sp.]|uniref:SURF1 family protein n=1 Tax=Erythrobacter sp. TaxID=1042 RepID=UPI0032ECD11F
MIRRLPVLPTILVLAAVATMIGLGIWQLGRMDEKAALIARYSDIADDAEPVPLRAEGPESDWQDDYLYRRVSFMCDSVEGIRSTAGANARGAKGWVHVAECTIPGAGTVEVALGFSIEPDAPQWAGGAVTGIMGPGPKVVADPALAGLAQSAKPDPSDLPNNHLAYAGQWFFFALTALVIYGFALRARLRERE